MADENVDRTELGTDPKGGPTIEESYASLVEEGILDSDAPEGEDGIPIDGVGEKPKAKDPLAKFRDKDGNIDQDKLAQSYLALEKGKRPADDDEDDADDGEADDEDVDEGSDDDAEGSNLEGDREFAQEVANEAGVDLAELSRTAMADGDLSDEQYEALEAAGYPREAVANYVAGKMAGVRAIESASHEVAGGAEAYDEMTDWAIDALDDDQIAAFDKAVSSNDRATVLQAVRALKSAFLEDTTGDTMEPEDPIGGGRASAGSIYQHDDEVQADMNDPRYDDSQSFRDAVMAKIARTEAARGRR